ncbi:Uncharacterised protein [Chlamydia trachomatis]|nr:Uncharacterised protein [Chlamydia trachomatis]
MLKAQSLGIQAQNAIENAVKSAHPQLARHFLAHQWLYALAHFSCCLVGESECHDAPWLIALVDEVHNLVGEHTRFARTCSGNHQLRSVHIHHSVALLRVELI